MLNVLTDKWKPHWGFDLQIPSSKSLVTWRPCVSRPRGSSDSQITYSSGHPYMSVQGLYFCSVMKHCLRIEELPCSINHLSVTSSSISCRINSFDGILGTGDKSVGEIFWGSNSEVYQVGGCWLARLPFSHTNECGFFVSKQTPTDTQIFSLSPSILSYSKKLHPIFLCSLHG